MAQKQGQLVFTLARFSLEQFSALCAMDRYQNRLLLTPGEVPRFTFRLKKGEDALRAARQVVDDFAGAEGLKPPRISEWGVFPFSIETGRQMWYDIKLYPALRTGTDLNWMKQKGTALMRSMKRAGALTLAALILAFSLTACGKDGGSSGSGASSSAAGSTSSSEPITVDLDAVTDVFLTTAGIPVTLWWPRWEMWTSPPLSCCTGWRTAPTACSVITAPISASPSCPGDTEDASGVTLTQGTLDNALRTAALYALIPGIAGGGGRDPVPGLPGHLCRSAGHYD